MADIFGSMIKGLRTVELGLAKPVVCLWLVIEQVGGAMRETERESLPYSVFPFAILPGRSSVAVVR